jgi:hypothetical protein
VKVPAGRPVRNREVVFMVADLDLLGIVDSRRLRFKLLQ